MNTHFIDLSSRPHLANSFRSFLIMKTGQRSRAAATGALAVLLLLGITQLSLSQNVSFVGTQSTVPAIGLHCPRGVAVDQAGDVFIADSNDSRVLVVPAGGGAQFTIGDGLNGPNGVTVDSKGNVYIGDSRNNRVVVVPANGNPQYTVGQGLKDPGGIAVDSANIFIADTENRRVVAVPVSGKGQHTVGSGLGSTRDVALDAANDLFIADTSKGQVVVIPANNGKPFTVGSGLKDPSGVVVDKANNVFISDPSNKRVVEVAAGSGTQTTLPISGLVFPYGVAVDGASNLYIVDHAGTVGRCPEPGATSQVVQWQRAGVNFGSVQMRSSSTFTLNYAVNATTKFGAVEMPGEADFTLSGNTCTGTLEAGSACVLNLQFAPMARGLREGNLSLTDSSGGALVTITVQGNGVVATEAALSSSPNPSKDGQEVTFSAAISSSDGAPPDGETIWFASGTTILGTGTLRGGSATFSTSSLPVGKTQVVAVYGGDSEFAGVTSAVDLQVVQ